MGANSGDSAMVLEYLKEEKLKQTKYDVLIINCGMHDIRIDRYLNKIKINQHEYETNLNEIIDIAKSLSNKVIWVGTTPLIDDVHNSRKEGFLRYNRDLKAYNKIAKNVMNNKNIDFIDLYHFTKNLGENIYCDHVHFTDEVRRLQPAFISGYITVLRRVRYGKPYHK
ncbi:SGNH/GDSL hydrolase family protein [Romboutsia sp.]|uniref:SGNH/GDSL hydrolase family protein n=1 Tax=Romboutsia sp. TaxID=1965302 RepID=UPI003F31AC00